MYPINSEKSPHGVQGDSEGTRIVEGFKPDSGRVLLLVNRSAAEGLPVHRYPVPVEDYVYGGEREKCRVSKDSPAVLSSCDNRHEVVDVRAASAGQVEQRVLQYVPGKVEPRENKCHGEESLTPVGEVHCLHEGVRAFRQPS